MSSELSYPVAGVDPRAFEGRVALVTGAAGGLGRAIVARLLLAGARVVGFDLRPWPEPPPGSTSIVGDATQEADVAAALAALRERHGRLDLLVNNAGRAGSGRVEELLLEEWNETLAANLTSVFLFCKHAIPLLRAARGSIVSVSSTNALTGGSELSGPAYAAAKAGIVALTKNLARDLAKDGVRVNAVAPGPIDTPMLDRLGESGKAALRETVPLRELGRAEDVAHLVAFLASDQARHITGVTVSVSGGLVMAP